MNNDLSRYRYIDDVSKIERLKRLAWGLSWLLLVRFTPRWTLHGWRRFILRAFGAKIGEGSKISPTCRIYAPWKLEVGAYTALADDVQCYCMDRIVIGSMVAISQRAYLCTGSHDISSYRRPLITKPIEIKDHVWVCAESYIGPGVTVGEGAVVAARACVSRSIDDWVVVGGNPARVIKRRIVHEVD